MGVNPASPAGVKAHMMGVIHMSWAVISCSTPAVASRGVDGDCLCDWRHLARLLHLMQTSHPTHQLVRTSAECANIRMDVLSPVWVNEFFMESLEAWVSKEGSGWCLKGTVCEDDVAGDLGRQPACHKNSHDDFDRVGDLAQLPSVVALCFPFCFLSACSGFLAVAGRVDSSAADLSSNSALSVGVGHCLRMRNGVLNLRKYSNSIRNQFRR